MILTLLALACTAEGPVDEDEPLDLRVEYPAPSEGGLQFAPADIVVPGYSDQSTCWVTTYEGPTIGVTAGQFLQNPDYGHHAVIMVSNTDDDDFPDGYVWDCTDSEDLGMENLDPLLFADNLQIGSQTVEFPEGMATKLKSGSRILVQSHYINPLPDSILVNDVINLEVVPEVEVETWAAPWVHTDVDFDLGPGEQSVEVTCTFEQDINLLSIFGHMHEWGTEVTIDHHKLDGSTERIYEVGDWEILFRDQPPRTGFEPGEFMVQAGESFTTTCNWYNDTDHNLSFPEEMCVGVGMAYPTVVALICEPD
ncbi:MAG: hypothetical protein H6739_28640 [Alphaproteobacteria bacterium]|nr:hypothetical protein [Alphaproteobacteria bacterium]